MFLKILLIQIILTYCIDMTDFIDTIKKKISKLLVNHEFNFRMRPFDCAQCSVFWVGILYIIIESQFSLLWVFVVCLMSFLTPVTKDFMYLIKDLLTYLINLLWKFIK